VVTYDQTIRGIFLKSISGFSYAGGGCGIGRSPWRLLMKSRTGVTCPEPLGRGVVSVRSDVCAFIEGEMIVEKNALQPSEATASDRQLLAEPDVVPLESSLTDRFEELDAERVYGTN
jgi:hypothetical protein